MKVFALSLGLSLTTLSFQVFANESFCDRSPAVVEAAVQMVNIVNNADERSDDNKPKTCKQITLDDLKKITSLEFRSWQYAGFNRPAFTGFKSGDFLGMTGLKTLDLSFNYYNFKESPMALPADLFQGLGALEELNLSMNNLGSLPSGLFVDLKSLKHLNLGIANISAIPADVFNGLSSLEMLWFNNNKVKALPSGIFKSLASIRWIDISNDALESVDADLFHGLKNLNTIELGSNSLTSLPAELVAGLSNLYSLSASRNKLQGLPPGFFKDSPHLKFVHLQENNLSTKEQIRLQEEYPNAEFTFENKN